MPSRQMGESFLRFRKARLKSSEFDNDLIGAGSAELDFAPATVISQRLQGIIARGDLGYALPSDFVALSEAASSWYARNMSWRPRPENFVSAPDITTAFAFILMTLIQPNVPVLVPCPGYSKLRNIAMELGFEVLEYSVRRTSSGYEYAIDEIEESLSGRYGGLFVLIHPHNPTGYLAQRTELRALERIMDRHGMLVFSDEIHSPLWLGDKPHIPYASISEVAQSHTITALSSSKAWGLSGVRVTQLALPDSAMGICVKSGSRLPLLEGSVSALGIYASIVAYENGDSWLDALRTRLRKNRDLVTAFATEAAVIKDYVPPDSSFLAWMSLAMDESSETAAQFLQRRAKLGVLGSAEFGSSSSSWFRLNFGSSPEIVNECLSLIEHAGNANDDNPPYTN